MSLAAVAIAAMLVALLYRVWDRPSDSANSGSSASASASQLSDIESRDADLAAERGWEAEKDYIASQPIQGQTIIDQIPAVDDASGMALGPEDAPVTVRVFGDFSCPMCTQLHADSMSTLEEMARDGKIRLEWHNFPIFEDYGSDKAARGSIAAAAQGKLWEYIAAVYGAAGEGEHPTYTDESVRALAESAGLDMARFDADYASEETTAALEEEASFAQSLGLRGTPTLLIGYAYASGAYPTEMLTNTIEIQTELAK